MLAGSAILLTTACSDNADYNNPAEDLSGDNIITFTIAPQAQEVASRSSRSLDPTPASAHIGSGMQADLLIFAVYDQDGNVITDFQNPVDPSATLPDGFVVGTGQNVLNVTSYPVQIQLSVDRTKKYTVAFWAQSSKTLAYDTSNLEKVEVRYNYIDDDDLMNIPPVGFGLNNDEYRDAFCAVATIDGAVSTNQEIILKRPLAQVNVGTTGYDYEGAAVLKPGNVSYTRSQITLEGVARFYNVVKGKALSNADLPNGVSATANVIFTFNTLPAFVHYDDAFLNSSDFSYKPTENEELLCVERDGNKGYLPYISWSEYDAIRLEKGTVFNPTTDIPMSETYKYLSMCYVLVPEAGPISNVEGVSYGAVLPSVKFEALGLTDNDGIGDVFEVNNVPVQKNWRTNLLGSNFFVLNTQFILDVVPQYCGDINQFTQDENWKAGSDWNKNPNPDFNGNGSDDDDENYHDETDHTDQSSNN